MVDIRCTSVELGANRVCPARWVGLRKITLFFLRSVFMFVFMFPYVILDVAHEWINAEFFATTAVFDNMLRENTNLNRLVCTLHV
jgi:hypothetical protein